MDENSPIETSEADAMPYVAPGVAQAPRQILLMGDEPDEPAAVLRKVLTRLYFACVAIDFPANDIDFDVADKEYDSALAEAAAVLAKF